MADLSSTEKAIAGAADALVADVVGVVRQHPQYAQLVNGLVDKAIEALVTAV